MKGVGVEYQAEVFIREDEQNQLNKSENCHFIFVIYTEDE